jgi:hypothetical protein
VRDPHDPDGFVDLAIELEDRPGALAEMGEALGEAGVSVEGGGVFVAGGVGHAHYLVAGADATRAAAALAARQIQLVAVREVVRLRLRQEMPGQLGAIGRRMADAGVNIEMQYSDHAGNLILLVADAARDRAVAVAEAWGRGA